jgi:hypothetical protein
LAFTAGEGSAALSGLRVAPSGQPVADLVDAGQSHCQVELEAIFLVAGDKAGNWKRRYRQAIPLADERFAEHLIAMKENEQ